MGPAVPNTCSKLTPCVLYGCYLDIKADYRYLNLGVPEKLAEN